jgi:predicted nucleic acid-binding protein
MIIVLDASAAIEIALEKDKAEQFRGFLKESDLVISPDTFPAEITNVFWKYSSFSKLPDELCERGILYCLDLVDDYLKTKDLCREVFAESIKRKHSAYDLYYLVLARRHNASILTNDKEMKKIAKSMKINVLCKTIASSV